MDDDDADYMEEAGVGAVLVDRLKLTRSPTSSTRQEARNLDKNTQSI